MNARRIILLSLVSFFYGSFAYCQVKSDDGAAKTLKALEGFEELMNEALQDFNVPGVSIGIVTGGKVVYAEGIGLRDLEKQKPMTPETLFAIGSTTKAMTATLLGMLVDDGKLDWDKPVRNYLPTFRLSDPIISERITPRDLVTHRSGLPRHDLLWYNDTKSNRSEIIERLAYLDLSSDLRERFQYNNLMFMTAGYLAGKLSGKNWEEVMRERLFEPLGMLRTNFSVAESQKDEDFAYPHRENDKKEMERIPFRPIDLIGPAGSVNSSVNEMCRWVIFNLQKGKVGDKQLINPLTLEDIQSPHMTTGKTAERPEISQGTYGMGWVIDTYRGRRRISHGGGIDGFVTSVMLLPDDDLGLVLFNNGSSGISSLINQHAIDLILGLESIDWLGEAKEKREKGLEVEEEDKERKQTSRVTGTHPSHPLHAYAGNYENPGYGSLKISLVSDALELTYNDIVSPLEHWHYDVWNGAKNEVDPTFENVKFIFRGDLDGNIAAVESLFEMRTAAVVFKKKPDPRLFDPEYLDRLTGTYVTADEMKLIVDLSGGRLTVVIAGQPTFTLVPCINGRFELQEAKIVSLEFVLEDHQKAAKVLIHSPGRISEALRSN